MNRTLLLLSLLPFVVGSAFGANYSVGIGVDCDVAGVCFWPTPLTINPGDTVTFYIYGDAGDLGAPHNVVADDGSFRCARGCDGEGGDGTPAPYPIQWSFTRTFATPGIVHYHDEASPASGIVVVQGASDFAIGSGITGAWYDPSQNGHGLLVEVLPGNRFYASWFAFNPAGTEQSWFTGVGTYSGNLATVGVDMPSGGLWIPHFNPGLIVHHDWGTLQFVFTDCNHGTVYFSSLAGYGSGSMNLTRLTQPAGLTC